MMIAMIVLWIIYAAGALFKFAWMLGLHVMMSILMSEKPKIWKLLILSLGWPIWLVRWVFQSIRWR